MTFTCHVGCDLCDIDQICIHCADPNSHFDQLQRSCQCKENFYASSLDPFICTPLISGDEQNACEINISIYASSLKVTFNTYYQSITKNNVEINNVVIDITIDTSSSGLSNFCKQFLITKLKYSPFEIKQLVGHEKYIDLPSSYVSQLNNKFDLKVQIPLFDIYGLAHFPTEQDDKEIKQQLWIKLMIGHPRKVIREHSSIIHIYTIRNEVLTFLVDVYKKKTLDCACRYYSVVVDLDTDQQVTLSDYTTPVDISKHFYTVGDMFYARIFFKDSTYTKQLSFESLFLKTDDDKIYNFTPLTVSQWSLSDHSLHIALRLIIPTSDAQIEVKMLIQPINGRRRFLDGENESQNIVESFNFQVLSQNKTSNVNNAATKGEKSNLTILLLQFFHILLLLIFL